MDNSGEGDDVGWVERDDEELEDVLRATCANPPRRFALCEDTDQMRVFAWGMDFGDRAMLTGQGILAGSFQSAYTALHRFGINRDLHLYWVDGQVDGEVDPESTPELGVGRPGQPTLAWVSRGQPGWQVNRTAEATTVPGAGDRLSIRTSSRALPLTG